MSLSGIPIALIVPPINFLLPCVFGLLIACRRSWIGYSLLVLGLGGLLLLSLPIVSKFLIASLEKHLPLVAPPDNPPGAIVILSGDTFRNGSALEVGSLTLERERAGAALHRRTRLPILVTGGTLEKGGETLGDLMALSLIDDFQVSVRWIEPEAQDTKENASLSATILRSNGIRSIYLVTHAWHMKRSLLAFANTGITVTAAPVRMDEMPTGQISEFIPRTRAWLDSYYALHEWIGYAAGSMLQ